MLDRDRAIVAALEQFRCLTRDDIAGMFFSSHAAPETDANKVLLRLLRAKRIGVSKERRLYTYFPLPGIKRDSVKIPHYLAIAKLYRELCRYDRPRAFVVEPKLGGKGLPEPDAFMIWRGAPMYVELQRSSYSVKQWREKLNRYEAYQIAGTWKAEPWQRADRKVFPRVWIVGKANVPERLPYMYLGDVADLNAISSRAKEPPR